MNPRIMGSGQETLILAYGYGGDQCVWDDLIPYLTRRYRVMLFDWNFLGSVKHSNLSSHPVNKYSSFDYFADDLIALVDEVKLRSCVFVGHSMSGMIGCLAAIKRADLFKRLILIGASPRYLNSDGYEGGLEEPELEQMLSKMETDFHTWTSNFAELIVGPNDPISVEKYRKGLERMGPEAALPLAKTIFYSDLRGCLDKVGVPCTILQTTKDAVIPISVPYYMQRKIKGKTMVEIIEGDGHFPQLTMSELVLDVIDKVLSSDVSERV